MIRTLMFAVLCSAVLFSSCAGNRFASDPELSTAERLACEKKYNEAAAAYAKIAKESAGTERGANALFISALARISHDNPSKDYQAALQAFDEFIRSYPEDKRSSEAQSWKSALKTILEVKKENEQLTKSIEQLKKVDIRHEERRKGK